MCAQTVNLSVVTKLTDTASELFAYLINARVTSGQSGAFIFTTVRAASVRDNQLNAAFRCAVRFLRALASGTRRATPINRWLSLIPINDTRYRELRFRLADPGTIGELNRLSASSASTFARFPSNSARATRNALRIASRRIVYIYTRCLVSLYPQQQRFIPLYFASYSLFEKDIFEMTFVPLREGFSPNLSRCRRF